MDTETSPPDEPLRVVKPPRTAGWLGTVLVVFTFVVWCMLVFVAYLGATVRTPPAVLTAAVMILPYLMSGYLLWTFCVWVIAPDRKSVPIALGLGLLSLAVLWGPAWPSWSQSQEGEPMVVMEWNVERLWGKPSDGTTPLACIQSTINEVQPDVLSLLEVSGRELDELKSVLDMNCIQSDYMSSGDPKRGGLAICVRGNRWALKDGQPQPYLDNDKWTYIFAELKSGATEANALSIHLRPYAVGPHSIQASVLDFAAGNPGPLQNLQEAGVEVAKIQGAHAAALLERVGRFEDPTVVLGDFNSTRDMALHYLLREQLVDTYEQGARGFGPTTYVGGWLPLRVDFIYSTPSIGVDSSQVQTRDCSDHRPVVSELIVPRRAE